MAMMWHVQYRKNSVEIVLTRRTPEQAIEAACQLIDEGCDVHGIGAGPLTDSIDRAHIKAIYAHWAKAHHPSA